MLTGHAGVLACALGVMSWVVSRCARARPQLRCRAGPRPASRGPAPSFPHHSKHWPRSPRCCGSATSCLRWLAPKISAASRCSRCGEGLAHWLLRRLRFHAARCRSAMHVWGGPIAACSQRSCPLRICGAPSARAWACLLLIPQPRPRPARCLPGHGVQAGPGAAGRLELAPARHAPGQLWVCQRPAAAGGPARQQVGGACYAPAGAAQVVWAVRCTDWAVGELAAGSPVGAVLPLAARPGLPYQKDE